MTSILTGLRTNSGYHIGNYIGAILPMLELQKKLANSDKLFLFLPDLHSLEVDNSSSINQNSIQNAKLFLACGIDQNTPNTYIYRQSRIAAHSQLQWILTWYTYMGEASRMTQFKDKSSKRGESIPVSLLTYPILQAADILLYDTDYIPVGEDQRQHIELTRDVAIRFNNKHAKDVFTIPKPWIEQLAFTERAEGAKIRSLTDPTKKMSKSDEDQKGVIFLTDSPEIATKKIMSSTTDSIGMIDWNWDTQPGITNLLQLLQLLTGVTKEMILKEWQGKERYGDLKTAVAQKVSEFLTGLHTELTKISDADVVDYLEQKELLVTDIANKKLQEIETVIGLR
jgi:tryptophanyl-tRNA synthetase